MKVRLGFVSNSSSASYTLLGFDATSIMPEGDERFDWLDESEFNRAPFSYLYDIDDDLAEGQLVVGIMLSREDEPPAVVSPEEAIDQVKELRERLGVATPIRIYSGTMMT